MTEENDIFDNFEEEIEKLDEAFRIVRNGVNEFSSSFFKKVLAIENRSGIISSPAGAAIALAIVSFGAREDTKREFKDVLHLLDPVSRAHTGYDRLIKTLNVTDRFRLEIMVFINNTYPVSPTYKELTGSLKSGCMIYSPTLSLNFRNNENSAKIINAYARTVYEQFTYDCTKDVISAGELSNDTSMVVVNVIYFSRQWEYEFKLIRHMPFHVTKDTTKKVPTMYRKGNYRCGQLPNMNAKFVAIPYKDRELEMFVIVPNEIDGLPKVKALLQKVDLTHILQQEQEDEVRLYLPKFKTEFQMALNSVLINMNLNNAFNDKADFSGISNGPLKINKVLQKVVIVISEEGIRPAAPENDNSVPHSSKNSSVILRVDRPSYYIIYRKDNGLILFCGVITVEP